MQKIPLKIPSNTDICDLFCHFQDQPWAMLLDSSNANHANSRFDIFTAEPAATLITNGLTTEITANNTTVKSQEDPLCLLQSELDKFQFKQPSDMPFTGGALGYWGYDLSKRYENIIVNSTQDLLLPDMAVGIYLWAVIKDNQTDNWWLIDHSNNAANRTKQLELLCQEPCAVKPFTLSQKWQSNMTKQQYREKFYRVREHLIEGDCYQINLAQRFSSQYSGSEWNAYLKLRAQNKAPFSAFIRVENAAVLSISPERFLNLSNGDIETKPIKGTRPRYSDNKQDERSKKSLELSSKDRAENLMIVDLLRNDIGKVATIGSVKVPELFAIESYPAVHHLVTTITAKLAEKYTATDLLRACFPGGSITGAPKVSAMQIIESLEPNQRSVYCGSIGYISFAGSMDTNIAIRTLVCAEDTIYCWAGGGLVFDSQCESEYQETFDKVAKILPILSA